MPKLTKRTVDTIRPDPGGDVFIWDDELKGFGVRVKPSGAGAFLVQYRTPEGHTRRMVLSCSKRTTNGLFNAPAT